MKPISIQLYTVRTLIKSPQEFRAVVEEIAGIGYAAVETGGTSDMKPAEFRKFLEDLGLRCSSYWAKPDRKNVQQLVDLAGELGFDCFVSCAGPDQFQTVEQCERVGAAFAEMAKLLAPHGLSMCYHNHWWEFGQPDGERYGWDIMMSKAQGVKAEIDIYWASNFGEVDVPAVVRRYAARTPLLHAKDGPLVKGEPHSAVGQGRLDNGPAIQAADEGVLQYVIVELDEHEGDMMQAVRDSYAYLTRNALARGRK
jgi:sugar phosphate isomerase/epimerase